MYLMVETIRVQTEDDRPEWKAAREAFKNELGVYVKPIQAPLLKYVLLQW